MTEERRRPGRPATGVTPKRNLRVGQIWDDAVAAAAERGDTIRGVVETALRCYVAQRQTALPSDEVVRRFAAGEPAASLAEEFGVARTTIYRLAKSAGVSAPPRSSPKRGVPVKLGPDGIQSMVRRYVNGESATSLAVEFGVGSGTVARWVRAAGESMRPAGREQVDAAAKAKAVSRYLAGRSSRAIAMTLGVSPSTVVAWVRAAGHPARNPGQRGSA